MKTGLISIFTVVSFVISLHYEVEAVCYDITGSLGSWVDDGSAAALIKSKCTGMNRGTDSWRKRTKVKDVCNSVSRSTPVATFTGKKFRGHAGILLRCSREGIHIYDQTPHRPLGLRTIPWGGTGIAHNAENFYVIH